jgi:hypothetical protein
MYIQFQSIYAIYITYIFLTEKVKNIYQVYTKYIRIYQVYITYILTGGNNMTRYLDPELKVMAIIKKHHKYLKTGVAHRAAREIINKCVEMKVLDVEYIHPFEPIKGIKEIAKFLYMSPQHYLNNRESLLECGAVYIGRDGNNWRRVTYGIPYLLMKWRMKKNEKKFRQDSERD